MLPVHCRRKTRHECGGKACAVCIEARFSPHVRVPDRARSAAPARCMVWGHVLTFFATMGDNVIRCAAWHHDCMCL